MINVGVNIIIVRERKILLGLRKNIFGAGTWALPGGHLEFGEKLVEGAARELLEETGFKAKQLEFRNIVNQPREDQHYIQVGFEAIDLVGEPTLCEPDRCEEWRWFELHSLPENIFTSHQKPIALFLEHRMFED